MLIDTLKVQRDLTAAGLNDRQAEAIVHALASTEDRVATKEDIDSLRTELRAEMNALEARLTRKMYGAAFLIITILGALNFFT